MRGDPLIREAAGEDVSNPSCFRYLVIAAVQFRTTVSGAASLGFSGSALTRKRCPSLVTA
jgi:hypothetical protein